MGPRIDRNVEMPERVDMPGKWKDLARQMEVGDSVFFEGAKSIDDHPRSLRWAAVSLGMRVKFFAIDGGVRVWRIE